jgi:predicted glutamine amidotransferase
MCRLFFSLTKSIRDNEPKRLLLNFFDKCEQEDINDGFGICWYKNNTWNAYKRPLHYREDPHIFRKVDNISSKVIIAHARNINKEAVSKYHIEKERCIENTHPILYKGHLFMHHGDLLMESEKGLLGHQRFKRLPRFKEKINELRSQIEPELLKDMKGSTDSELLLFLFLSFQKKLENKISNIDAESKITREEMIATSFLDMTKAVETTGLTNRSNIIMAVGCHVLIAKISNNPSRFNKIKDLPLYINSKGKDEIVVSSVKLTPESENLSSNVAIIINHKKNSIKTYKIQ